MTDDKVDFETVTKDLLAIARNLRDMPLMVIGDRVITGRDFMDRPATHDPPHEGESLKKYDARLALEKAMNAAMGEMPVDHDKSCTCRGLAGDHWAGHVLERLIEYGYEIRYNAEDA